MASTILMSISLIPKVWSEETISWVPNPELPNAVGVRSFFLPILTALEVPRGQRLSKSAELADQLLDGRAVHLAVPEHLAPIVSSLAHRSGGFTVGR